MVEKKFITEEYFNGEKGIIEHRIKEVEDSVKDIKSDFTNLKQSLARTEGYQEASLRVLEDIKENTKDITDVKVAQTQLNGEVKSVLKEFEGIKSVTKDKSKDNREIIVKLIWLAGTLGAAALGASWLFGG